MRSEREHHKPCYMMGMHTLTGKMGVEQLNGPASALPQMQINHDYIRVNILSTMKNKLYQRKIVKQ